MIIWMLDCALSLEKLLACSVAMLYIRLVKNLYLPANISWLLLKRDRRTEQLTITYVKRREPYPWLGGLVRNLSSLMPSLHYQHLWQQSSRYIPVKMPKVWVKMLFPLQHVGVCSAHSFAILAAQDFSCVWDETNFSQELVGHADRFYHCDASHTCEESCS